MSTFAPSPTYTVRIMLDTSPGCPREWDNLGTMTGRTGRGNWTDKGHGGDWTREETLRHILAECGACDDYEDMSTLCTLADAVAVVLPVYRFEHGGVAYSCRPFACKWDSGQVGYIFVSLAKVAKEYGDTSPATLDRVREVLRGEVETYGQWANGEVYGYTVEDAEGSEVGGCWGFYGSDHEASGLLADARALIPDGASVRIIEK